MDYGAVPGHPMRNRCCRPWPSTAKWLAGSCKMPVLWMPPPTGPAAPPNGRPALVLALQQQARGHAGLAEFRECFALLDQAAESLRDNPPSAIPPRRFTCIITISARCRSKRPSATAKPGMPTPP
jgi:hypothetical protein